MRGFLVVMFWNLLLLKWHISPALPLLRSPTALVANRYLWQLRVGWWGRGGWVDVRGSERSRQTDKEREGERQERRAGPLRGCQCSTPPSRLLHANEKIPLQQQQQRRQRRSWRWWGQPQQRCWHCTAIVPPPPEELRIRRIFLFLVF